MVVWCVVGELLLIFDIGCGVGLLMLYLVVCYLDYFVIGIDQLVDCLVCNMYWDGLELVNFCFVCVDLVDYWWLVYEVGLWLVWYYLFYFNFWFKIGYLVWCWQGYLVFFFIVVLGGQLECCSNWQIYVEEFILVVNYLFGGIFCIEVW